MTVKELRDMYFRLSSPETVPMCGEVLDIYIDCGYRIMTAFSGKPAKNQADRDASVVWQMMWTKLIHLRLAMKGATYTSYDGGEVPNILDPLVLAGQVRTIYEMSCMFHIVYLKPKTDDARFILYNLWVYSGLAYRQNMYHAGTLPENVVKRDKERQEMDQIKVDIKKTVLYNSLDADGKSLVDSRLKTKKYLMSFDENNKTRDYNWFNASMAMQVREGAYEKIYNFLSQYAHPSYVSVFQFENMFDPNHEMNHLETAKVVLTVGFMFISTFIADYVELYPEASEAFHQMPYVNQMIINSNNLTARGDKFTINNSGELLGKVNDDENAEVDFDNFVLKSRVIHDK